MTALPPAEVTLGSDEPEVVSRRRRDPGESSTGAKIFGYGAILLTVALIAVPLYFIAITSFKQHGDIYSNPISWWPNPWEPGNYAYVMDTMSFGKYLRNSLIITSILTVVEVTLGVLSAYAFAFLRFPGRNALFILVIAALMVPNQITIISNYALVANLGWRNTFQGIIIPLAGVAFGTFLMRNHFMGLPSEIMEAARLDGTSFGRTLFRVVLPMSWPTVVAFALITIVTEWNQYLWPFLIASDATVAPLPIGLTQLQQNEGLTNWGPVMAGTVLTTIPILIVFIVLQKQMIKGLTAGAVKG